MDGCYALVHDYGIAIILFTVISKVIMLPAYLWTYFNSITMIRIQPDINFIKAEYYGQPDEIAEAQSALYKEKKYHPIVSTIPLLLQLVLLVGVVGAIRLGMADPTIDMRFGPLDLSLIPSEKGLPLIWVPIVAGLSAWLQCEVQNRSNVLQAEQSKFSKIGTIIFTVGLSLFLGWFVPIATALYWVCSNLLTIVQLFITNAIVRPKQYVDYERLARSQEQLEMMQSMKKKKESFFSANRKRERADYKRFFSVLNKHLVFYSESNGFYKYFKGYIEYILKHTNLKIHYITSDPNDAIFTLAKSQPQILPYYIGENKLITLMMKMDADMVVMTMPDLENFHIKRSYVRDDVEYVFAQHGIGNNNLVMRKGCVDHFDTIFCCGIQHKIEVEQTEEVYGLPHKKLIEVGYPLIDEIKAAFDASEHTENVRPKILIAPSYQDENIVDSCLETLLDGLKGRGYDIIVRPHPQEVRLKHDYISRIKQEYDSDEIEVQTDFSSNNPIMEADLMITDWSGICWEYAFTTFRPTLFINTPMKVKNPDYQKIAYVPINITLRDQMGKNLNLGELDQVGDTVQYLLDHARDYRERLEELSGQYLYNRGHSAEVGAKYIIESIQIKMAARKASQQD